MIKTFKVGAVHGKCRPRFTKRGIAYKAPHDAAYENLVQMAYKNQCGNYSFGDKPVSVSLVIQRALPKSKPRRIEREHDTVAPDVDNCFKAVTDALNGIAYDDDKQIIECYVIKLPRYRKAEESVTVTIKEFTD